MEDGVIISGCVRVWRGVMEELAGSQARETLRDWSGELARKD